VGEDEDLASQVWSSSYKLYLLSALGWTIESMDGPRRNSLVTFPDHFFRFVFLAPSCKREGHKTGGCLCCCHSNKIVTSPLPS